ncbi:Syntaxin-42 [Capsicum annuum]|nr:Syntaxin-42 [Capsicum annuum]
MPTSSFLNSNPSYAPLSTQEDVAPSTSRFHISVSVSLECLFPQKEIHPPSLPDDARLKKSSPVHKAAMLALSGKGRTSRGCEEEKSLDVKYLSSFLRDAFTVGLPPAWVDVSEEVAASIHQAQVKLAELKKCHAKALTPSFGDGREDQHVIEVLTMEITDILRKSEKRLQKLSARGSSEDSNVRKNVQRSLATDLQNLSVELRRMQSLYLKQLRQQSEGHDGLDLEMNEKKSSFLDDDFNDVGFTDLQMATGHRDEQFTAEREREIRQVLKSVNELAQILKDLSVLVIDQGTIVDRIDHNVQSVSASVEEGFKQLQKVSLALSLAFSLVMSVSHAERSQRKGGMVKCATVLFATPIGEFSGGSPLASYTGQIAEICTVIGG